MSDYPRLDETGLTHLVDELADKIKENENVQSDWNISDSTSDAFIKNKPSIFNPDNLSSSSNTPTDSETLITKEGGSWVTKTFGKGWDYTKGKIGISASGSTEKYLNEQGAFAKIPALDESPSAKTVDYAPIISVSDALAVNAKDIKAKIEPVQDLHGYDKPWVGGTGKNLFNFEGWLKTNNISYTKDGDKYTFYTDAPLYTKPFVFADSDVPITLSSAITFPSGSTATNVGFQLLNKSGVDQAGRVASATANACMIRLNWSNGGTITVEEPQIEEGFTPTSFAPYSNICPITGWDEVNVTRSGKNLLNANLSYDVTANTSWLSRVPCKLKSGTYTFTCKTSSMNGRITFVVLDAAYNHLLLNNALSPQNGFFTFTFTIDEDASYIGSYSNFSTTMTELMIRSATETDATWEPYKGNTYTIDLNGTRYGGTLDVTTGELTLTHGFKTLTGGEGIAWTPYGQQTLYSTSNILTGVRIDAAAIYGYCSAVPSEGAIYTSYLDKPSAGSNGLEFKETIEYWGLSENTSAALNAKLAEMYAAGTPLQICYELATPQTIQLTSTQIKMLQGYNTLFSDTGDTQLTYYNSTIGNIGEAVGELESNKAKVYTTDDSATTTINDSDYIPISDNTGTRKKALWSTVVAKVKDESTETVSDNDPYIFRQGKGNLVDMDLVGGTVAWNQLVSNGNFSNGISTWFSNNGTITATNNKCTFTVTNTNASNGIHKDIGYIQNHKYFATATLTPSKDTKGAFFFGGSAAVSIKDITANKANILETVVQASDSTSNFFVYCNRNSALSANDTCIYENVNVIDLTQMFGTTIADAIYAMEQANAGDGVAFFRKYFPKDYYAYNAGSLLSVKPSGRIARGFNIWDEQWEMGDINSSTGLDEASINAWRSKNYIRIIPNTVYYVFNNSDPTNPNTIRPRFYDANKNYLGASPKDGSASSGNTFTSPDSAHYMRFAPNVYLVPSHDLCINISDPTKNGTYKPYDSSEYLFSSLDLRGIPKLVDNKLSYDGDIYRADGSITRKYGIVDLGTLNWEMSAGNFYAQNAVTNRKALAYAICTKYTQVEETNPSGLTVDKTFAFQANVPARVSVKDSTYSDAATFKTAMSGVYLVYELATPTTESAPIYVNPQRAFTDGTEEWLDDRDVAIPVGHNSTYYLNETYPPVTEYVDSKCDVLEEEKAERKDLASINVTGTTNSTGSTIASGTYFYLNDVLVKAKADIASGATFTKNTNYEEVTAGSLNDMNSKMDYMFNIVRGRQLPIIDLGTSYTAELKSDISSGKFEKAIVGGKLTINGHVYYLAHPDYWLHTGDTECTTHHMLVVPADNLTYGKMNSDDSTAGGYIGSGMKSGVNHDESANSALANVAAIIKADFGAANILTHREYFTNAVANGKPSGVAWYDSDIDLMNENMVYGTNIFTPHSDGSTVPSLFTIDKTQIKLFAERPDLITIRANWWLRDVVSAANFANVGNPGYADYYGALYSLGVRPVFAIC